MAKAFVMALTFLTLLTALYFVAFSFRFQEQNSSIVGVHELKEHEAFHRYRSVSNQVFNILFEYYGVGHNYLEFLEIPESKLQTLLYYSFVLALEGWADLTDLDSSYYVKMSPQTCYFYRYYFFWWRYLYIYTCKELRGYEFEFFTSFRNYLWYPREPRPGKTYLKVIVGPRVVVEGSYQFDGETLCINRRGWRCQIYITFYPEYAKVDWRSSVLTRERVYMTEMPQKIWIEPFLIKIDFQGVGISKNPEG